VFLALRELSFARGRFALMGVVVALMALLIVLLSGLSVGLVNDGVSGLQRLPVTAFAFQQDVATDAAFSRSAVDVDRVGTWAERPGVAEAAPFGTTLVNARSDRGVEIDLALFGVQTRSFLDPEVARGARLAGEGEVVISRTAAEEGIEVGDTLKLEPAGTPLKVVGVLADQHTYGHVDVGYLSLRSWQEIAAGVRAGDAVPGHVYAQITAVAIRARQGAEVDLAAGDRAAGTSAMTLAESFGASPGYTAETSTLRLIQVFLYVISALVVGAFFTVLTIQRKHEIAVVRALGASTGYLLRDSVVQCLVMLVISAGAGVGLGVAAGTALSSTPMPFALDAGSVATATALLIVLGVAGATIAVLRIARVDPLTALGAGR
jgi:putative ABC transport system permease protein